MRLQEMFHQEKLPCELQPTLRTGIVVIQLEVGQQHTLPLEGKLAEVTSEGGLGPGPDTTVDFFLMFFVDVIIQTVPEVEL